MRPLNDVKNLGVSAYLFFQTLFDMIILLATIFLVYGIYSLATNVIATNNSTEERTGTSVISLSAKQSEPITQQNKDFYYIQCWIGLLTVVIWGGAIMIIKMFHVKKKEDIDQTTKTCADYSVVIHNVPMEINK